MSEAPLEQKAPLIEHLIEFRTRLIRVIAFFALAVVGSYFFAADIYAVLVEPLANAFPDSSSRRLIYTGLTEAFFTYVQLACFSGFILSFPVLAWQLYGFLAPGLYARERRALVPFLMGAPVLFAAGASLAYFLILPMAWRFFLGFESPGGAVGLPIQLEARVGEYLGLVMHIIIAFGVAFQLPIILAILNLSGVLSVDALRAGRRWALLAIVVFAAVVTPPDVFSQLALAAPMYLLYECSIQGCRLLERRRANADLVAQPGIVE